MKFKVGNTFQKNVDTVVCFLRPDYEPAFASKELQSAYDTFYSGDTLKLKNEEIKVLRMKLKESFVNLLFVSFDCAQNNAMDKFRAAVLKIGTKLNELKAENVYVDNVTSLIFSDDKEDILRQLSATLPMSDYRFDNYKEKKSEVTSKEVVVFADTKLAKGLKEGAFIAEGICVARDLVNEPANTLTPKELADRTVEFGKKYGFEVEIIDKDGCEKLGMHAFLEVAKASVNEPKLIVMRYNGAKSKTVKGIIGKGLCYDSGGLALKPTAGMMNMKGDMAGAAAVIGAMCSIAANKLKKNVVTVVAACENLVDGEGYRNGDIINSMSGKTILIGSTDAEGRLTLADAMTYIINKENVDSIVELSTLTGACANFFGGVCSAVLTTNDSLFDAVAKNSEVAGEKYWRLPVYDEYKPFIKPQIADLFNTSSAGAGGICAGMFLNEFSENTPFLHMDIAGIAFRNAKTADLIEGGTGYGVKSVYYYIKN